MAQPDAEAGKPEPEVRSQQTGLLDSALTLPCLELNSSAVDWGRGTNLLCRHWGCLSNMFFLTLLQNLNFIGVTMAETANCPFFH